MPNWLRRRAVLGMRQDFWTVARDELTLPSLDDLSEDERAFLRVQLGRARGQAQMVRSQFIEAHVGRLVGASWPKLANAPHDLRMGDIRIQVRSAQPGRPFKFAGVDNAEVFVFVEKPSTGTDMSGMRYWVLPTHEVAEIDQSEMILERFAARFDACAADDLIARIQSASGRWPDR